MEKSLKTLVGLSLLLLSLSSWAEIHYAPQNCHPSDLKLMVLSADRNPQSFWIQLHKDKAFDEIRYEVEASSSLILHGEEFLQNNEAFAIKIYSSRVKFYIACTGLGVVAMQPQTSPVRRYSITSDDMGYHSLSLLNLSPTSQDFSIRFYNQNRELIHQLDFHLEVYMETGSFKFLMPLETKQIEIEGVGRMSSSLKSIQNGRVYPAEFTTPYKVNIDTNSAYFLLSNENQSESFVIKIEDANLIKEARKIIKEKLYKLTIAQIEPGVSYNRDFSSADRSPYSWHVAQVKHFADLAHIDCDGSPSLVEERYFQWMQSPYICFWSYHLKRELTEDEARSGLLQEEHPFKRLANDR